MNKKLAALTVSMGLIGLGIINSVLQTPLMHSTPPEASDVNYIIHCPGDEKLCGKNLESKSWQRFLSNKSSNGPDIKYKTSKEMKNHRLGIYYVHLFPREKYSRKDLNRIRGCKKTNIKTNGEFYEVQWEGSDAKWHCMHYKDQNSAINLFKHPFGFVEAVFKEI